MIRVLIVEDEPPILRAIASMIERLDGAFRIAGRAQDGEQALSLLESGEFDVVFTDIRMPVLDGLELMEILRARYPQLLTVVISGYGSFEYTSHALRNRAFDYLLKPVDERALAQLLNRLKQEHARRRRARFERVLAAGINRAPAARDTPSSPVDKVLVALFCAGSFLRPEGDALSPGEALWNQLPLEDVFGELFGEMSIFIWPFMGETPVQRVAVVESRAGMAELMEYAHEYLLDAAAFPVSCACLMQEIAFEKTGQALKALESALDERMVIGRSLFVPVTSLASEAHAAQARTRALSTLEEDLTAALASGVWEEANRRLNQAFALMRREGTRAREVLDFFGGVMRRVGAGAQDAAGFAALEKAVLEMVCCAGDLDALRAGLIQLLCEAFARDGARTQAAPRQGLAEEIEQYLRENYAGHITAQTLADQFGYVPGYISMLFRRAMGVSPSEYLTALRVEQAKQIMKREPGMMIKEVAERVGFKNQYHFSKTFKKYTGLWPTGYRGGDEQT